MSNEFQFNGEDDAKAKIRAAVRYLLEARGSDRGDIVQEIMAIVSERRLLQFDPQGAHRYLHRELQPKRQAIRLDQSQGPSKAPQSTFRQSMIPGARRAAIYSAILAFGQIAMFP
jgi:hypothetical protein